MPSILPPAPDMQLPPLRIGSLCSGYGGLELGVQAVLGGTTAWVSDIDKGVCKILAHRFPGVPNIGDMTAVDWSSVEPVDLICGGTPCQDLSHAGKRAGMTEGTRSNLWVAMREAIAVIRPRYVVWENVRGAASAEADSDLVNDPRLLAGVRRRDGQPVLRALGRVVGDLSDLGYVGQVRGLRAADVGAPHGRFRYFILAHAASDQGRLEHGDGGAAADAGGLRRRARRAAGPGEADGGRAPTDSAGCGLLPTPRATDGTKGGPNQRGSSGDLMLPSAVVQMLPTPTARDWKNVGDPEKTAARMAERGQPLGEIVVNARLVPTPTSRDWRDGGGTGANVEDKAYLGRVVWNRDAWGQYAEAIDRWETLTRPAPAPTELNKLGNHRLSAAFSEWMMGLPAGWVTDVPGITRNEALKALGNGVVPQQCAAALREMVGLDAAKASA